MFQHKEELTDRLPGVSGCGAGGGGGRERGGGGAERGISLQQLMLLIFLGCASKRLVSPRQKGQRRRRGHGAAGDTGHSLPASAAPGRAASPPSSSLTPRPRWQRAKLLPPAHNGSRSHCGTAFCLQQPGCNSQEVSAGEQNRC